MRISRTLGLRRGQICLEDGEKGTPEGPKRLFLGPPFTEGEGEIEKRPRRNYRNIPPRI